MLSNSKISSIFSLIREITHTDDVYLFGSYANGNPHGNSDLDVAIIKDNVSNEMEESFAIRKKMMDVGYVPLDLVFLERGQFNTRKNNIGSIYYEVSKHGKKISA